MNELKLLSRIENLKKKYFKTNQEKDTIIELEEKLDSIRSQKENIGDDFKLYQMRQDKKTE